MRLKAFVALLLVLALVPRETRGQSLVDAEVAKGIKQVEDGDLAEGIFTLDAAVRRLSGDSSRGRDLGQAYLYLGIAYLGKGQETLAKTKFREAVQQVRELSLSPDQFPPKVLALLEAAKKEAAAAVPPATPASPQPAQGVSAAAPKGRSKLPFILLGGAAVAGGAAVVSKGGGASGSSGGVDLTRFYGTYANLLFTTQSAGCNPFTATLLLSGNPDGSNFQINKTFPFSPMTAPVAFTGTIQSSGNFTGSGGDFSITGQTTASRIGGSESKRGDPVCTWTFDGPR